VFVYDVYMFNNLVDVKGLATSHYDVNLSQPLIARKWLDPTTSKVVI